jgi:NhaP-type Na+/H+ or K+/H+ antiporter
MKKVAENDEEGKGLHPAYTPLTVLFDFFKISLGSILIGMFTGILCTIMTKKLRFISQSAVFESTLLISFAMLGYLFSEMIGFSAICSLLVSSIIYSHYTWYNLSPQG